MVMGCASECSIHTGNRNRPSLETANLLTRPNAQAWGLKSGCGAPAAKAPPAPLRTAANRLGSMDQAPTARLSRAQIQDLHRVIRRDLDVGGFQIAMDHAMFVCVFQRIGDLAGDWQRFFQRDWVPADTVRQRRSFGQFHYQRIGRCRIPRRHRSQQCLRQSARRLRNDPAEMGSTPACQWRDSTPGVMQVLCRAGLNASKVGPKERGLQPEANFPYRR